MGNGASKERPRRSPSAFNLRAEVSGRRGERNRGFPVISGGRIPNLLAGIAYVPGAALTVSVMELLKASCVWRQKFLVCDASVLDGARCLFESRAHISWI